jgi:hypothetical protein
MELTASQVEQKIPKRQKQVSTFVDTVIDPLTADERQQYESVDMQSSTMPLFSVTEGEHNYIYSFNRLVSQINAEIKSRKDFFEKQLTIFVCPILIAVFVKVLNYFNQTIEPTNTFNFMLGLLFAVGVYCTAQTIYRHPFKAIKKLKAIKKMVFDSSPDYLAELEAAAKKPVINI